MARNGFVYRRCRVVIHVYWPPAHVVRFYIMGRSASNPHFESSRRKRGGRDPDGTSCCPAGFRVPGPAEKPAIPRFSRATGIANGQMRLGGKEEMKLTMESLRTSSRSPTVFRHLH
eukprot:1328932-Amorphochlora_amoeboformis.AAC.1